MSWIDANETAGDLTGDEIGEFFLKSDTVFGVPVKFFGRNETKSSINNLLAVSLLAAFG